MKMKASNVMLPIILFLSFTPMSSIAQEDNSIGDSYDNLTHLTSPRKKSETTYRLETFGSLGSSDNTPFWLQHHKWGTVPLESGNYYLRAGASHKQRINRNFSFELGLDLIGSSKQPYQESFWLQQAYGKLKWKSLQLSVGMTEDYRSVVVDPMLSLGDFIHSNNARPNPEVRIGFPNFTAIPYTNNALYIKADIAIGTYLDDSYIEKIAQSTSQQYTSGVLSHSKSLNFRVGNIERQETGLQVTFGVDHHALWGGTMHLEGNETVKIPKGAKDFLNVLILNNGVINVQTSEGKSRKYTTASHLASLNFRADYGSGYGENIYSIYYQHPAENSAGLKFNNSPDMLVGIQYKSQYRKALTGLLFEYFYSKHQNGRLTDEGKFDHSSGDLNNYNNSLIFFQGRSHFGMTLGSSIFLSPRINSDNNIGFKSNRNLALHGAVEGYIIDQIKYSLLGTYAESLGTYLTPYDKKKQGVAGMLSFTYLFEKISGFSITGSGAFNSGKFFESDSYGGGITIKKTGKLF